MTPKMLHAGANPFSPNEIPSMSRCMALPRKRSIEKAAALAGIRDLNLFLEQQRRRLTELCVAKLHDEDAADEVTQRVLIKFQDFLSKASASQLRTAKPANWLTVVACNDCTQYFRDRESRLKERGADSRAKPREVYASELPEPRSAKSVDGDDPGTNLKEPDPFESVLDAYVMASAGDL